MKRRSAKRALLLSVLSIFVCVVMLAGSTFAWFTDTASSGVNRIQSGTLDLKLEYATAWDEQGNPTQWTDVDADDAKDLSFIRKTENGYAVDPGMRWEPGGTYQLQQLRVSNAGNLAFKYKVEITGIRGDAVLNDVIDWTVKVGEEDYALGVEHHLPANDGETAYDVISICGHMQESAGNEYQEKTIESAKVRIYAVQDAVESDSYDNQYDAKADGTPQFDTWLDNVIISGDKAADQDMTLKDRETNPTITAFVPAASTDEEKLTLTRTAANTPGNIEVVTGTTAESVEVSLKDADGNAVTAKAGTFFTLTMSVGKNLNVLGFYHRGEPMTKAASAEAAASQNDTYYYDAATGIITYSTDDFSPFTVVISKSVFNGGNGTAAAPYLIATGEQACKMETSKGYFKLVDNIVVTDEIYLSRKTYVVDLNGHTIRLVYAENVKPNNGSVLYIGGKNGKLTINDTSAAQTGAVIGSDKSYTNKVTSAVRAGNYGRLTINGGHFYGMSEGTSCIFVMTSMSSGSKATVVINGGTFETATPSSGTYFVLNHQDGATAGCTITVNGGSFKNYNPGVTTVDPVNAKTGTIMLGAGCKTTERVDGSDTWYTVSK